MLDKETFFASMDKLVMAFPNWKLDVESTSVMQFWYTKFRDTDNERFSHMVDNYIENENFSPTIKGLKDHDTLPRKSITQVNHEKMLKENGLL